MVRYGWCIGWWMAVALPGSGWAQAPAGDGLRGAYYQGRDFEQYVSTRRDAAINFDWHEHRPVAGVGAEYFSVRWTGWLVPPASGRYVLHLSVDDGIRLWLNERLLLDDWHSQGLQYYQVAVDLRAGQAYSVRLDYCQAVRATQVRLAWEPPATPGPTTHGHFRRGLAVDPAATVVIPTRYLFTAAPALPQVPPPVAVPATSAPPPPAERPAAVASVVVVQAGAAASARPRPRSYLAAAPTPAAAPPRPLARADSGRVAAMSARLATGQPITLRALYFEQGQAQLLPAVQASLDTLAWALASRPALRFEVQGHTDNQGDPAINQRLSRQRAEAVCAYLAARGVAASRLHAVGYGGSRPVADNREPSQRPRNRRVVLKPLGRN